MVTSKDWTSSAYAKVAKAKRFMEQVLDSRFWKACAEIVKLTKPLMRVLRIVDNEDKLVMRFLYQAMYKAREEMLRRSEQYPKEYYPNDQTLPRRVSSSSSSSTTSVHVTALDGLVNVNSLFTIAVFVGLSLTTPGQRSLENRSSCDADVDVAKKLLVFEVVSFSFFLFSSLVAQGLKLALNLLNSKDADEAFRAHINLRALRLGMLGSAIGSVMGCLFLVLSMVNVIEIRLGMLSCGSKAAAHAVAAMVV
ncbi:hypothetical protein D0Y65_048540 [Glycine soja]|uniref:Uncharacterized protein n=1 Tax=Glycine soja TaxID=3848 RepID=A0A445FTB7_GLYSO|nr:hypothetical protein D0Y65_048540 [Glycine soja]